MSNSALEFRLNDTKSKSFLDDLATSKALIPQIKRIAINRLNGNDSNLNLFLSNWVPQNLTFLSINNPWIDGKLTAKMSFYSSSLTTSLKKVTKEIFLQLFEMDESDLESVIKASCNSERLVLYWCDLKWSRPMNFKCSSTYKIKCIWLNLWGRSPRKTEWLSNPSLFSNIVSAIGDCGLRNSLTTLNVYACKLDKIKVQQMFDKNSMSHVKVIEDVNVGYSPLK